VLEQKEYKSFVYPTIAVGEDSAEMKAEFAKLVNILSSG
jgi:hypothetical protein